MKFDIKNFLCGTAFALSATPVFAAQNVIEVDDTHPGIVINKQNMMGADLAIWYPPTR